MSIRDDTTPGTRRSAARALRQPFPLVDALLVGIGLGGFFDGIVLHQLLQWHHMVSSWYPPTTLANLRLNTLWDGLFHSATWLLVVVGFYRLWRRRETLRAAGAAWSMLGVLLAGWGVFNLVEGVVDHQLLGVHHVNERVPASQWMAWDAGFLCWGLAMLLVGWHLHRGGNQARLRAA